MFMCTYVHIYGKIIVWVIYVDYEMSCIDSKGYRNSDELNVILLLILYTKDLNHCYYILWYD